MSSLRRSALASVLFGLLALVAIGAAGCGGSSSCTCDPACPTGYTCDCQQGCVPENVGPGADLSSEQGDIGMACNQVCAGATPYCNAMTRNCVPCLEDKHCPLGQLCKTAGNSSLCVPGCADDSRCGNGTHCCGGTCIDTSKDVNNCGGCGTVCGSQHATARCEAGACVSGGCFAGWGDCNKDPKDGCETNLNADPKNCTACGMVCSVKNAIAGCSAIDMPACYIAACNFGFDDCDSDPANGCETSVLSDARNCGGCGMPCPAVANAKNTCSNAACVLTSCNQGFADCDKNPKNGCEVNIGTDVNNCGACGFKCGANQTCINNSCTCLNCVIPGAKTKCVNNQCMFDTCLPGMADCDGVNGVGTNGCEKDLTSDPKNCSGCGVVCPMNTPSCSNSQCVVGLDFGPMHSFTGLTGTHYITQGGCGVNNQQNLDDNAKYFCLHFYGQPLNMNCLPVPGYVADRLANCGDSKMHKNGGCTGNGNNIPNTTCDGGACKIGNWAECTSGVANIVCHCQ